MQVGFAGTPVFAATILDALIASQHNVVLALTQPSRPAGRGRKLQPSPVQALCETHRISCHAPTNLRGIESLLDPLDVLVVAAYGMILPKAILEAPRLGCMNVHASLLPRWRGAAPIEYAILHGDTETGVSIMQVVEQLDAGPVYRQAKLDLTDASTTTSVTADLASLGSMAVVKSLDDAEAGNLPAPRPQCEAQVTYAPRLDNDAARIHWEQSAAQVARHIRAFHGRGMAFTTIAQPTREVRVRILAAKACEGAGSPGELLATKGRLVVGCGDGALTLESVQLNVGKGRPMRSADAVNGFAELWEIGSILGQTKAGDA